MSNWKNGFVDANGIRVHYYRTGGDKPQVVLNHGALDDGLCWTRVTKALEQEYDVIMFDARGHGLSASGNGDYSSETRAKDLAEAIKILGLHRPVIGGHSMGADVSIQLAAMVPEIPRAIFLEDPPISLPGEPVFGGEIGEMGDGALKMMARVMKLFRILPVFMGKPLARKMMMPVSPDDEIIPWLNSKKRLSVDFMNSLNLHNGLMIDAPFETVQKITVPTLLIMGDREKGAIVSQEVAQKMAQLIPDFKVVHLVGATHDIRRVKFDEYMEALKTFLAESYT